MKKNFILCCIFLLLPLFSYSQNDKDFILTLSLDTLYGKIRFSPKAESISFHHKGKKTIFHVSTLSYFGVNRNGKTQVYKILVNHWKEYIFVKVLAEGKLDLYYYDTKYNERYTRSDPYRYYIGNEQINPIRMSPRSYRHILERMLTDRAGLMAQLSDYEDVPRIVRQYNQL